VPKPQVGIVKRVLQKRQPELILDVSQDPDYYPFIPQTQAQMTIPLLSQDRLVGVLFLETRRPEKFTQEVFEFIQLITTRIAVAVDNAQLHATTRQQLAELRDLYTQISQLEQLKTDMIRIAAHDLGNPLTSVSASIDFLLDSELDERQADYAHLIKESGQRMKKIIRDILSLQRIEELAQGQLTGAVDLAALTQEIFRAQTFAAAHKNQDFRLDVPDYPAIIVGDEAQLREAIANLMGNAIKYTPEGGSIRARVWEEDDFFLFEVQDNGYGIPEDQQERLFQPFFRAQMP
jgi:signal transduction histidine kinase